MASAPMAGFLSSTTWHDDHNIGEAAHRRQVGAACVQRARAAGGASTYDDYVAVHLDGVARQRTLLSRQYILQLAAVDPVHSLGHLHRGSRRRHCHRRAPGWRAPRHEAQALAVELGQPRSLRLLLWRQQDARRLVRSGVESESSGQG
eukprot:scaffold33863_cov57-Phaeocystis_antarctica.AAC.2